VAEGGGEGTKRKSRLAFYTSPLWLVGIFRVDHRRPIGAYSISSDLSLCNSSCWLGNKLTLGHMTRCHEAKRGS